MGQAKIEFEESNARRADVEITDLINRGILKSVSYGQELPRNNESIVKVDSLKKGNLIELNLGCEPINQQFPKLSGIRCNLDVGDEKFKININVDGITVGRKLGEKIIKDKDINFDEDLS